MLLLVANSNQAWNLTHPTLTFSQKCKTQMDIDQVHARLITTGLVKNPFLTTKLILKFSSSPHTPIVEFARFLFFSDNFFCSTRNQVDPFLWNVIMKSFSHGKDPYKAFEVFCLMLENGVFVDEYSLSIVLKACSRMGFVKCGMQVHGLLRKLGFGSDVFLQNCLISMYVRCGCVEYGHLVFDRMFIRDSVSYNTMIDGYVKCGMLDVACCLFDFMPVEMRNFVSWNAMLTGYVKLDKGFDVAWELFDKMPQRDLVSWNLMLCCCVKSGNVEKATSLFKVMPKKDVVSWAIMVDGYAKTGNIDVARRFFDDMPERDVISCNAIMAGYVKNGYCLEALKVFHDMLRESSLAPDSTTVLIALSAVAELGYIDEGIALHCYIEENGFLVAGRLGVALIDMYAKCGSVDSAIGVFDDIQERTVDHWNAMIGGLAIHGFGDLAFQLFMEMERLSLEIDDITFIAVLNACGHSGLVKEGMICFEIMRRAHHMEPKLQHYGCMVDILSRAGQVEEAIKFVNEMPIYPNDVVWRTLLSSCRTQEDIHIGGAMDKHLVGLNSHNSSSYVLLSNIYAQFGKWDYVRRVRTIMKERDLKKIVGSSRIELQGIIHEFSVGDKSHDQVEEIYSTLQMVCM
ncbi:pentatricopeptide repeat-containing protein At2g45350, chloroplastic [Nicotiana tomentosiformis]|uniref:pentatricopeptide repeat-containing protein At2g45350, chloroplastic n=1 Tax=Nicotiana tomentosiformis TaxID=4098 RepID=UPI00051BA13B|nr:pentatricopeptide repeat-containing protein At2g45350, chloroplastic [Nicotiana tomentosiformis]XP_016449610.1 PREDICTED: pentatricopeptide repeat-containing protein At2g45350, chloroplastic-like [Nicotiana tabacum]